jgi:formylglycine-generating enzyme required for sulfatase activity/uncharacterized caspase-like protein
MGKNWAIAIGINGYRNLQRLNYAQRDAESVCSFFQQELAFEQIYTFTDNSPPIPTDRGPDIDSQPTYATLRRFLRVRFDQPFLKAGDNLWFFFAGHGVRHDDRDYLMPIDADPGDVESTAIPIHYVTERLRRCGADNVVVLIDACRSGSGRRDGVGIGEERQQGVITLFSCSPRESSYEIAELQQGAFTYVLLESLRLQGEGNCATVERLYHRLRDRVAEVSERYGQPRQTPYGFIEPPTKYHLILLPRTATLRDVEALKVDAFRTENVRDLTLAEQLWIRVLIASPGDSDAIEGIRRIDRLQQGTPASSSQPETILTTASRSASEDIVSGATQYAINSMRVSRRQLIEMAPYAILAGGISAVAGVRQYLSRSNSPQTSGSPLPTPSTPPSPSPETPTPSPKASPTSQAATPTPAKEFEIATVNAQGKVVKREKGSIPVFTEDLGQGVKLELSVIPAGTFQMGSPETEAERDNSESPQHSVNVPAFWMGRYQITQAQWKAIAALPKVNRDLDPDPSKFKGSVGEASRNENRPVELVSWFDAVEFCDRLSQLTKREYRLPTEAEWEYACRARTTTPFHFGVTITTDLANYCGIDWKLDGKVNSGSYGAGSKGMYRERTTDVGSFPANAFGLYDMHGNVWEWCMDHWHDNYSGSSMDSSAWLNENADENALRVMRGGSWNNKPVFCRSASRYYSVSELKYDIGFRVVCLAPRTLG